MQFSRVHLQFGWAILSGIVRGRLSFRGGHRPVAGHTVGNAFVGVGVAAAEDPAVDDYIVERLRETGIRHVRLDFSPGDETAAASRLLMRLIGEDLKVTLHLVQPLDEARRMPAPDVSESWRSFVSATLDRFGSAIEIVEAGSTTNRKRWAGHSLPGFLAMWEIVWKEARARGLTLAGPSVTDFEPLWNIGLLALLRKRGQLPDLHTDNLFSERCTEPERYDHKILGRTLAPWLKFNLIKKARLLARLGAEQGVPRLFSPSAFWTLPRIERLLPDSEEKQADYLARYMVLCAASGALERAWWGPLICHREGLIDNGKRPYPALERVTYYSKLEGICTSMRMRPALHALRGFASLIPGALYEGRLNDTEGLEIHAFRSQDFLVHAVWAMNGRAASLGDIYEAYDFVGAVFHDRDGLTLDVELGKALLIGESPRYVLWPATAQVRVRKSAALLPNVALAAHGQGARLAFRFRDAGWRGVIHARSYDEFECLLQTLHPTLLHVPERRASLRYARNAIWRIGDPRKNGNFLVVKKPVRMPLYRRVLDRNRPVKALRAWSGACELLRVGVDTAYPVAYFEYEKDVSRARNFYVCDYVSTKQSVREVFSAFNAGIADFGGVGADTVYLELARYVLRMHNGGAFFRDMSSGNILVRTDAGGVVHFSLIDTGRIRMFSQGVPLRYRLSDLARICNKLQSAGRKKLLDAYFSAMGMSFAWYMHFSFVLYDSKVWVKRNLGRKAVKRLGRRFKKGGDGGDFC
ncbi:MAG: lipopolysaccharide kinase InaA family protein [Propionivibrio sp.]